MSSFAEKPLLPFTTPAEWEAYLAGSPDPDGVRLLIRKKGAVDPGLTRQEALDVALCHGWIDGQAGSHDTQFSVQAFTPRRRASPWSIVNREHVVRLIEEGRMRPAGQAEIDRAKADGRWDAAYRQKGVETPADLQAAIDADPAAAAAWAALGSTARWPFIFRLTSLKRAETRERRVREYAALLAAGRTLR
ncbi:YdeI/OmpD-associated family protein [Homoserinibacter sp. YIM 151385]|uniref:YdeI/OmpD-associated family protein n=1 Tax=Homoserinibacter sp. YIM 151385 TaxID=2985506 RepID=UPI0022F11780|nr:YdeI/OmpD-associated family protein [Homoserinibacter sp. YIM 151385]WBU37056.1 YdeI/OmpD-associated family protein [Homoserinibacter sp. YIM 151385]